MRFSLIHSSTVLLPLFCICSLGEPQGNDQSLTATTTTTVSQSTANPTTAAPTSTTSISTPDEINEAINIKLDGRIFPPSILSYDTEIPQDFSVNCVDCAIKSDISLSAGGSIAGDQISTSANVTRIPSNFSFTDTWVGATFDSLDANFEFGINLTASKTENELTIPINSKTISRTFDFLTLTAIFNTELHGWVNTTRDVNFTYGFNFSVPPGSELLIDLKTINQSVSLGFNESKLEPIPFNATTSDAEIGIELSFRPSVTFIASIGALGAKTDVQVAVGLDVPKLDVDVKQVHNVDSACNPAAPTLPPAQVYTNLTLLQPSIGFDAFEVFTVEGKIPGLDLQANKGFSQNFSKNLTSACYFFDATKQALNPPSVTKPANLSSANSNQVSFVAMVIAIAMAVLTGI